MTEHAKLEALRNIGPVKTDDDVMTFHSNVMGLFIEAYDAMFKPTENSKQHYKLLVDNIAEIAVLNVPRDDLKNCIHIPSISVMLEETPSAHQGYTDIVAFAKENGRRNVYENLADFIVSTRHAIIEKAPEDYKSIFKIKTIVSPGLEAYEKVPFNELNIKPELASYARVF